MITVLCEHCASPFTVKDYRLGTARFCSRPCQHAHGAQPVVGVRFGRLVVTQANGRELVCACDCGVTFTADRSNVRSGGTRSCGCLAVETARANGKTTTTHGHAGRRSPEYSSWSAMITRCLNPRAPNFAEYGGRGITVCDRWRNFALFLDDMGPRPRGKTLDRIDGSRGYEPGNCRWATGREQQENRRTARMLTIGDETRCVTEWARRAGISDTAMLYRVRRGVAGTALLRPSHHGRPL